MAATMGGEEREMSKAQLDAMGFMCNITLTLMV